MDQRQTRRRHPEQVRELLDGARSTAAFFPVLFGVAKGPTIAGVAEQFGDERVRAALAAFAETGARPLREEILRRLETG